MKGKFFAGALAGATLATGAVAPTLSNLNINNSDNKILLNQLTNKTLNKEAVVINGNNHLVLFNNSNFTSINSYLSTGQMLSILSIDGNLYKVRVQETGNVGYITKSNLQLIESGISSQFNSFLSNGYVVNVSTDVHLRAQADINTSILKNLKNGTTVEILGSQGQWVKVNVNGTIGFIYKTYISTITKPLLNNKNTINNNVKVTENISNKKILSNSPVTINSSSKSITNNLTSNTNKESSSSSNTTNNNQSTISNTNSVNKPSSSIVNGLNTNTPSTNTNKQVKSLSKSSDNITPNNSNSNIPNNISGSKKTNSTTNKITNSTSSNKVISQNITNKPSINHSNNTLTLENKPVNNLSTISVTTGESYYPLSNLASEYKISSIHLNQLIYGHMYREIVPCSNYIAYSSISNIINNGSSAQKQALLSKYGANCLVIQLANSSNPNNITPTYFYNGNFYFRYSCTNLYSLITNSSNKFVYSGLINSLGETPTINDYNNALKNKAVYILGKKTVTWASSQINC